ncbi:hypothetical protein [Flectobacillus rivi]|uniref:DUF4367 domain-containing protein n=1 Tax=Flectobacillus rivi TaxID=2984209 RepID=A0ABT6Z971_9BACT|nr:hypothetical protein [Flectobacillus rivi]MDI9877678.1 hypothetical protein [Flectobacillus rivi]
MSKILHIIVFIALSSCTERQKTVQQKVSSFYVVKYEYGKSDTLWTNHIPEGSDRMVAVDSFDYTIHQKSIQILKFTNPDVGIDSKVEAYFEKSLGIFLVKSKTWSLKYQLKSTDDSVEACIDKMQNLDFVK